MALPANHADVSNHRDIKGRALDWLEETRGLTRVEAGDLLQFRLVGDSR